METREEAQAHARSNSDTNSSQELGAKRPRPHEEDADTEALVVCAEPTVAAVAAEQSTASPPAAAALPPIPSEQQRECVARELAMYQTIDPAVADAVHKYRQSKSAPSDSSLKTMTLLEASIMNGDLETVRLLLDRRVHVGTPISFSSEKLIPIAIACKHGQLEIVKLLVDHGALVNVDCHEYGTSPLCVACRNGHFEIVKWLVENSAVVNDQDWGGSEPLIEAVRLGDLRTVRYLISAGAHTAGTEIARNSAWCIAVKEGKLRVLKCLVENKLADLTEDEYLRSDVLECATEKENVGVLRYLLSLGIFSYPEIDECLCIAAKLQNVEIMKLLVSNGAEVNEYNIRNETPLFIAIQGDNTSGATETLISLGADVNTSASPAGYSAIHIMSMRGKLDLLKSVHKICGSAADFNAPSQRDRSTPLHMAASRGQVDIVRFLVEVLSPDLDFRIENRVNETALTLAARGGHLDVVRLLVSEGAPINDRITPNAETALCAAAGSGQLDVVQFLCENGANALWRSENGVTALWLATSYDNADIVEYLTELIGADQNAARFCSSALNKAVLNGCTSTIRVLFAHDSQARSTEQQRCGLLCQAIVFDRCEIVRLLVQNGFNVNAAYSLTLDDVELELTPLHVAASRGDLKLVTYLCENGADVEGVSNQNETALFFAAARGKLDVVQYLVSEQNANVQITSSYGFTPAEVSSFDHHREVYEYLVNRRALHSLRENFEQDLQTRLYSPLLNAMYRPRTRALAAFLTGNVFDSAVTRTHP